MSVLAIIFIAKSLIEKEIIGKPKQLKKNYKSN